MTESNAPPPLLPETGPDAFDAPWQAHAFALTVSLHEAGLFTWNEWAQTLSAEIGKAQAAGDPDRGDTYYQHWLNALERIGREKGLARTDEIDRRSELWRRAYLATPHGQPVLLRNAAPSRDL